ncbi:hypothetical protein C8J56DRAFT_167497 [Mycena floridula]|nr:hypothetical protein C8J56DRAFT_167497 [Mycena floridula]
MPATELPHVQLLFDSVSALNSCASTTFTWVYNGLSNQTMRLAITNEGVTPSIRLRGRSSTITKTLATSLDPYSQSFSWPTVNVSAGSYMLVAEITSLVFKSPTIFVANGSNNTCLLEQSATSSTSLAPTTPTIIPSTATTIPSTARPSLNRTAIIAGTVCGTVVLVFALAGLVCLLQHCRRRRRNPVPSPDIIQVRQPKPSLTLQIPNQVSLPKPSLRHEPSRNRLEAGQEPPENSRHLSPTPAPSLISMNPSRRTSLLMAVESGSPTESYTFQETFPQAAYPSGLSIIISPLTASQLRDSLSPTSGDSVEGKKQYNLQDPSLSQSPR